MKKLFILFSIIFFNSQIFAQDFSDTEVLVKAFGGTAMTFDTGDINGDGDIDIVSGYCDASDIFHVIKFTHIAGFNFTETEIGTVNGPWFVGFVELADIDSDGDLDIFIGGDNVNFGIITYFLNDGAGNYSNGVNVVYNNTSNENMPARIKFADFNADGHLDFTIRYYIGSNDRVSIYTNDGSLGFTEEVVALTPEFSEAFDVADIDSDGDIDIVTTNGYTNMTWYENDLNNTSAWITHEVTISDNEQIYSAFVADFNNDGNKDIVIGAQSSVNWYENDGSENFTEHEIINSTNYFYSFNMVPYYREDTIDIITGAAFYSGYIYYSKNTDGLGTFTNTDIHTEPAAQVYEVKLADIDDDTDQDIICMFAQSGGYRLVIIENYEAECANLLTITSQPEDAEIAYHAEHTFSVVVEGNTTEYAWFKNDVLLSDGGNISGATTANLTIIDISDNDEAAYFCVINSSCDEVISDVANLAVTCFDMLAISQQPNSSIITYGEDFSFTVVADQPDIVTSYQWYKDDVILTDAGNVSGSTTDILNITSATYDNAGTYFCELTSTCDTIVTDDASLFVNVGIEEQNQNISIYPNPVSSILNIDISNNTNVTVTISSIAGTILKEIYTESKNLNIDVSNFQSGVYFVSISDENTVKKYKILKQ